MLGDLLTGVLTALQPLNLLILLFALTAGFFAGAMPGISGTTLIVVLMPVTFWMDPIPVFVMMAGLYASSSFSGAVSAILFRIPGTSEAVATTFDGYPMAQKGLAGEALGLSMTSSAFGGMVGALFLFFLTKPLTNVALRFSSPEYFALALMGLTMIATLSAKNLAKGLLSAFFGLLLASVGPDALSANVRFSFGVPLLRAGLSMAPIMTGLFGISQIMRNIRGGMKGLANEEGPGKIKAKLFSWDLIRRCLPTMGLSSLIGTMIGILPGVGGSTASVVAYSQAANLSKHPEEFGKGAPEGVAAPEAANNAAGTASFIPLFSLGIPGSATSAIILGAFVMHGLQPGPLLMTKQPVLVYTTIAALFLINLLVMVFCKPLIAAFVHVRKVPYSLLAPLIFIFCCIGTYNSRNAVFDLYVMLVFGLVGYVLEKLELPLAPIILGYVLGPTAEIEFRRALHISGGELSIFVTRPICLVLLLVCVVSLGYGIYNSVASNKKKTA